MRYFIHNYALKHQSGQSLTEFLVALVVLVPLLLMVPMLGKYIDINQTTLQASRYVAWEKTVDTGKSDATLAAEVRRRFYGNLVMPIKTGDVATDGVPGDQNAFLLDHHGNQLLASFNDVSVSTSQSTPTGLATALQDMGNAMFNLPTNTLYTGTVGVNIANVANLAPLDAINLSMTQFNVILADAWDAGTPANEVSRVSYSPIVLPPTLFGSGPIGTLLTPMKTVLSVFEPAYNNLDFGYVAPDIVPADRK